MNKRRPAVIVSPRFRSRANLCTVVPLSTTKPNPEEKYHFRLQTDPVLPHPYNKEYHWVKADMLYTVSFSRLSLLFEGKDDQGKRIYDERVICAADLKKVQECMLYGLGMGALTPHL